MRTRLVWVLVAVLALVPLTATAQTGTGGTMANYQYGGEQPTDDASKKFMGVSYDEGAENSFVAIKGYNLATVHSEKVADMGVKDNDAAVLLNTINTTGGNINTSVSNMSAKLPATLGQKAMAASLSVTMASDQTDINTKLTARTGKTLIFTAADPTPTGTDVVNIEGNALIADNFDIRVQNTYFVIPLVEGGYSNASLMLLLANFDQVGTVSLYGSHADLAVTDALQSALLLSVTVANGTSYRWSIARGAGGQGATAGGAAVNANALLYNVPSVGEGAWQWLLLHISFPVNPTAGTFTLYLTRQP